jgi:FADH2 O2-dependent halogenase
MIRVAVDTAVIGAGFSGSLLALLLHHTGQRVVLFEKGRHPRFALGESSTPLTNLELEEIASKYDLPWLAPLAEHGSWKRSYPGLPVGLKRGFTFAHHQPGQLFEPRPDHGTELMVTASPNNEVGDTHWLRADFDQFVADHAVAEGVPYFDHVNLGEFDPGPPWRLRGEREGDAIDVTASFVVDATGFDGALVKALGIESSPETMRTRSWSVYSHFADVALWADVQRELGADLSGHPFTCDDAALHHVLGRDGWMWVLRFDNGITSAGTLFDPRLRQSDPGLTPLEEWDAALARFPSVARQFRRARPVLDWRRTGIIQRRARQVVGPNWALISSAAYSLDAMFSTGNSHAMLCVRRLARMLQRHTGRATLATELDRYATKLQREIDFLDQLVHGCYLSFGCFPLLAAWTMYYFTGAIAAEHRRRGGEATGDEEILSSHIPEFRQRVESSYLELARLAQKGRPSADEIRNFERRVARDIAPWNIAGLCDPAKLNLYPFG